MPNVKTFNDYYRHNDAYNNNMKILVQKTKLSLDYAYQKFGFIHCDLHWGNILVDIITGHIFIFDFGLSELGGIKNIPLLSSNILLSYNLDYYFNIFNPILQWEISKESFQNTIAFKKNKIYKEIFHAYDYFRLIIENYQYNIDISRQYLYTLNQNIFPNIIDFFNLTDSNRINQLYNLFQNNYEFNKLLICAIYYYCSIKPKNILNIHQNKTKINTTIKTNTTIKHLLPPIIQNTRNNNSNYSRTKPIQFTKNNKLTTPLTTSLLPKKNLFSILKPTRKIISRTASIFIPSKIKNKKKSSSMKNIYSP
jgi:hypothetical protein